MPIDASVFPPLTNPKHHGLFLGTVVILSPEADEFRPLIAILIDKDSNIILHMPNFFVSAVHFQSFTLNAFWYFFIFHLQRPTYPVYFILIGLIFLKLREGHFPRIFSILLSLSFVAPITRLYNLFLNSFKPCTVR